MIWSGREAYHSFEKFSVNYNGTKINIIDTLTPFWAKLNGINMPMGFCLVDAFEGQCPNALCYKKLQLGLNHCSNKQGYKTNCRPEEVHEAFLN
jgi:predicted membrane GTPase involved in stress response